MSSRTAPSIVVVGSGGHAKVVVATARAAGWKVTRVVDDDAARWGQAVLGVAIDGRSALALDDPAALVIVAIGDNATRDRVTRGARCTFATLVHPRAFVDETVRLGAGTVVFAGAVIQPDARIGCHTIVNTSASIDHDCVIGDAVHVAPGVHLSGAVTLGDGVLMGIGSHAIPAVAIGAWSTIGAGATVVRSIPARTVAVGVPARPRT